MSSSTSESSSRSSKHANKSQETPRINCDVDSRQLPDVLATLKRTSDVLGPTFSALGQQAAKAAEMSSAIVYMKKIHTLEREMEEKHEHQSQRLTELRALLQTALNAEFMEELKVKANELVATAINEMIADKVRQQLAAQIPPAIKQQAIKHRRQILQVQTDLCNSFVSLPITQTHSNCPNITAETSEARRFNASVHHSATALTVPLRPLLRPLPTPAQSPAYLVNTHKPFCTVPPTPMSAVNPTPPQLYISTDCARDNDEEADSRTPKELEIPTPSEYFPVNLQNLMTMGAEEADMLVRDYGLVDTDSTTADTSREDNLNKFMNHIGVPYKMVPPPKTRVARALSMLPPLIIDCK